MMHKGKKKYETTFIITEQFTGLPVLDGSTPQGNLDQVVLISLVLLQLFHTHQLMTMPNPTTKIKNIYCFIPKNNIPLRNKSMKLQSYGRFFEILTKYVYADLLCLSSLTHEDKSSSAAL